MSVEPWWFDKYGLAHAGESILAKRYCRKIHYAKWHEPKRRRTRNPTKRGGWRLWCVATFSPVNTCDHCGRMGRLDRVQRWDVQQLWDDGDPWFEPTLCMGCMNRWRAICRAEITADRNGRMC